MKMEVEVGGGGGEGGAGVVPAARVSVQRCGKGEGKWQ